MFKINYTKALIIILLITTFSGAIRKWVTTSGAVNNIIFAIILISPLLLIFYKDEGIRQKEKFSLFYIYVFFLIIFAFNPLNYTIYHGILGIMIYLTFFTIILSYFKNQALLDTRLFLYICLAILGVEVVLGSIQYVSPGDSFINRYAVEDDSTAGAALVGDAIRVTGTYSYIAGYSAFLYLSLFSVFYCIKKDIFKQYSYVLLAAVFYCALISGSRGAVGFVVLTSFIFLVFEAKILVNSKTIMNVFGIFIVFIFFNTVFNDPFKVFARVQRSYDNFAKRAEDSSEEGQTRVFADINDVLERDFEYKLSGVGLGSTYQGANAVFGTSNIVQNLTYEGEQFRLIIEGGYILFLLRAMLLGFFISKLAFSKLFKIYLFTIIILIIPIVFNVYGAIYLALGLILLNQAYLPEPEIKSLEEAA